MFIILRLIIGIIFLLFMVIIIKIKFKYKYKFKGYIFSVILSVILVTTIAFLPFENLFITFDSPEAVYNYVNFGKSNIELVVSGKNCDFIIDDKKTSYSYLIVPKCQVGWKIGIGSNTKMIMSKIYNDIVIDVFQYKNTNDYFIVLLNTKGESINLKDSNNSVFYSLKKSNKQINEIFITYFVNVFNLDSEYWLSINGERIPVIVN